MSAGEVPKPPRLNPAVARLLGIALLIVLLMIPATMIRGVVQEREQRRADAVEDIVSKWGGAQAVIGPVLRVPFATRRYETDVNDKRIEHLDWDVAYFLPRRLNIEGRAKTQLRQRGMHEVPVYTTVLRLEGAFAAPDFTGWNVHAGDIDWTRAELMLALSQPQGLNAQTRMIWGGQELALRPSTGQAGEWTPAGVHAPLGARALEVGAEGAPFVIELELRGATSISFAPAAEQTEARLSSDWSHPSFRGRWLPSQRDIDAQGFRAHWSVSYLGRDYPQRWRESKDIAAQVLATGFGVAFDTPVDPYSLADRITKYALMTLVLTFAVIWLTEVLSGARAHPIQYAFIGAALCLFGLLQVSFAEHFGFAVAYLTAAAAVTVLVTLYSHAVLARWRRALAVGGVQAGLYAYLYMILQAEDYALLGGSLALFAGLAAAMYLTRKVNWFASGPATPA